MKTKQNTSRPSMPNFTILGFLGIYFLACSFIVPLFSRNYPFALAASVTVFLCMGLGYFMQAAVSAVLGYQRQLETRAYEPESKYYKTNRAFPVWIIALILSFGASALTDFYLRERAKQPTVSYDPDSALPFLVALFFFIAVVLGSFVWFFPYNRLMTGSGLTRGLILLFIFFYFHTAVARSETAALTAVFLVGYAFCALFSANQFSLGRTYRGTVVSFMTPQTRKYNLLLSLGLIVVFLGLLFVAYLIVNGVRICVLAVLAALFRAANNNGVGYTEEEEKNIYDNISTVLFGREDVVHSANYWLFIVFVIFFVVMCVAFLTRRRPEFKRIIARLKAWIVSLFEFIWLPIRDFSDQGEEFFTNYIDEEIKIQKDEIRAKRREGTASRMTWNDFNSILRSKHSEEEKYRFAYSTFVSQLLKMPFFVKKSDTPRKIRERLSASGKIASKHEIEMITEAFEQIEYADKPATPETEKALEALCDKIRENM